MDVCHNAINKLPAEIGACTNLRHLNISFNRIPGFPSALGNLEELTYFAFDTNLLRRLPLEFRKLRQLTRLQALILLALLVLVQRTQKYKC
jgi:leucine-rich repeat protein SHOC2